MLLVRGINVIECEGKLYITVDRLCLQSNKKLGIVLQKSREFQIITLVIDVTKLSEDPLGREFYVTYIGYITVNIVKDLIKMIVLNMYSCRKFTINSMQNII